MVVFDRKEDYRFIKWARLVKERDGFQCRLCGRKGGNLNAHHIYAWNKYPEYRFDISNGITLCSQMHHNFHRAYGYGDNNGEQFDEFVEASDEMKKDIDKKIKLQNLTDEISNDLEIKFIIEDLEQKLEDGYFSEEL